MTTLMVSISGVRGIIGQSLTPEIIAKYSLAFGSYIQKSPIIVGGDSRTSGTTVKNIVKGCLQSVGCDTIDVGIVPTPTLQMEILHHKAAGGIAITASHNPSEWNGLKFMGADGRFLNPKSAGNVFKVADSGIINLNDWQKIGKESQDTGANQRHIDAILNLSYLDIDLLRKKNFSVAVDCVNGAGGLIIPNLLEALGCKVHLINEEATGLFAHIPEPLPENLDQLTKLVKNLFLKFFQRTKKV